MIAFASEPEDEKAARLRAQLGARSVVLVGMMGAGKSSVGKRLARRLGLPFADADNEIESRRRHVDPRDLRPSWRAGLPRRRAARHRPPAGGRPAGARHRRRRLHERGDAGAHRRARPLGLAEGRSRRAAAPGAPPRRPPAAEERPGGDADPADRRALPGLCRGGGHRPFARGAARHHGRRGGRRTRAPSRCGRRWPEDSHDARRRQAPPAGPVDLCARRPRRARL